MAGELATPPLRLTREQYDMILGHCFDGLPDEACGLLAGPMDGLVPTGEVHSVHPCRNSDRSARTYTVDSRDYLRAMRGAEERGDEIVGVWHSHTHTDAYPSPTDVRQAVDPAWAYVIVSLRHGEPVLRSYRIRDAAITEMAVEVESVDNAAPDGKSRPDRSGL
jgi:proteasome lid subunit RPN8/RPN11